MRVSLSIGLLGALILGASTNSAQAELLFLDTFPHDNLDRWRTKEGTWRVRDGKAVAEGGYSILVPRIDPLRDAEIEANVAYSHNEAHAAVGVVFRLDEDSTGYALTLRDVQKGVHPEFGPWERPVLQLWRLDRDGWKLLQESKVEGCRSGLSRHIKVVCRGPHIWAFYEDMTTPVLTEFDDHYDRAGAVGLWKDRLGVGSFDNVQIALGPATPTPPLRTDWSRVRGAVYVRSDAVNSVQMWHDYWDHTDAVDHELSYAALYGFNMVQVYLHWIVWDRHGDEYLKRIEDLLTRASRAGLKVNFILWDDCGHVEPSLTFASPVPGRHNSQMMPNPSHRIRDSNTELLAHKDRLRGYVEGILQRFKDDDRIAFWQLYNEGMGSKERYRSGESDANLNLLLGWTREWIKGTGTKTPVSATGGGFYGPKYSDFYTYHSYGFGEQPLPNADGGPEHLCTETLNRPDKGLASCLLELAGKQNGFVVWELMIGRDNCRYPWGHPDGLDEPAVPFHGVVYPDGHPWDVGEVEALLGADAFASLKTKVFRVEYFNGPFKTSRKTSLTPRIDFDLGDEPGTGAPDASAGVGKDDFSIRWTGRMAVPVSGTYVLHGDSDGILRLWFDGTLVLDKDDHRRRVVTGEIALGAGRTYQIKVEYIHRDGPASNHLSWSGPGFGKRILLLDGKEAR
jgi:PA14 domain